jgi:phage gp46-like protein
MSYCSTSPTKSRRTFWTTQPDACGISPGNCGGQCGIPGLQLTSSNCGRYHCTCCPDPTVPENCLGSLPAAATPRSIVTSDWLRSLMLNILYTNGKLPANACGYQPGSQGGHWSESFRDDGEKIGSQLRAIPATTSIQDAVRLIETTMQADLNRLVVMKLASSIKVVTEYLGGNKMKADVQVFGQSGEEVRVGLSGDRLANSWVWS